MGEFKRGQKEEGGVLPTSQKPSHLNPSWLRDMCTSRKDSESPKMGRARWLARDNPETHPITIKPETASHEIEGFSCCSPPRHTFPIKSLALSACVSHRTIHFQVLDESPLSGPRRGPPSCNNLSQGHCTSVAGHTAALLNADLFPDLGAWPEKAGCCFHNSFIWQDNQTWILLEEEWTWPVVRLF